MENQTTELAFPPQNHPAWNTFCDTEGNPRLPNDPGTYWYDNCWGTYDENRIFSPVEPMRLTIAWHDEGWGLTHINGEVVQLNDPSRPHVIRHYQGRWAPLEWEKEAASV